MPILRRRAPEVGVARRPQQCGNECRQANGVGNAVIENDELKQNRRAAHNFHIPREERSRELAAAYASARNRHTEYYRDGH